MPEMILVETQGRVGLIRLNRPAALNALCDQQVAEQVAVAFGQGDGLEVQLRVAGPLGTVPPEPVAHPPNPVRVHRPIVAGMG